jgi:hypothetical protein
MKIKLNSVIFFLFISSILNAGNLEIKEIISCQKNDANKYFAKVILVKEKCQKSIAKKISKKNLLVYDIRLEKKDLEKFYPEFFTYKSDKYALVTNRVVDFRRTKKENVEPYRIENENDIFNTILKVRNIQAYIDYNIKIDFDVNFNSSLNEIAFKLLKYSYTLNSKLYIGNKYIVSIGEKLPNTSYMLYNITNLGVVILKKVK